jgi:hypothetical protein
VSLCGEMTSDRPDRPARRTGPHELSARPRSTAAGDPRTRRSRARWRATHSRSTPEIPGTYLLALPGRAAAIGG